MEQSLLTRLQILCDNNLDVTALGVTKLQRITVAADFLPLHHKADVCRDARALGFSPIMTCVHAWRSLFHKHQDSGCLCQSHARSAVFLGLQFSLCVIALEDPRQQEAGPQLRPRNFQDLLLPVQMQHAYYTRGTPNDHELMSSLGTLQNIWPKFWGELGHLAPVGYAGCFAVSTEFCCVHI